MDGIEREVKGAAVGGQSLELRGVWDTDGGLSAGHPVLHGQVSAASVPGTTEALGLTSSRAARSEEVSFRRDPVWVDEGPKAISSPAPRREPGAGAPSRPER